MKRIGLLALTVALACMIFGCKTIEVKGSGIKGKTAAVEKSYVRILDYQGATFGSEIPLWVVELGNGNYASAYLASIMPGLEGKKAFVTVARGDNLEFTKQWTDLVDAEVMVGDEIQRIVTKGVQAAQRGRRAQEGDEFEPTVLEQELDMYKAAVSNVEINGLEKIASYWILKEVKTSKKAKDSKVYYEYYAVWAMSQKLYNQQIKDAMKNVSDNTDAGRALKEIMTKKLEDMLVSSNDKDVTDEADDQLFDDYEYRFVFD